MAAINAMPSDSVAADTAAVQLKNVEGASGILK